MHLIKREFVDSERSVFTRSIVRKNQYLRFGEIKACWHIYDPTNFSAKTRIESKVYKHWE